MILFKPDFKMSLPSGHFFFMFDPPEVARRGLYVTGHMLMCFFSCYVLYSESTWLTLLSTIIVCSACKCIIRCVRFLSVSVPFLQSAERPGSFSLSFVAFSEETAEDGERPPGSSSRPASNLTDRDLTDSKRTDRECTHTYGHARTHPRTHARTYKCTS